jgi:uncharacterized membrane protein SpoIIM required for sporulation
MNEIRFVYKNKKKWEEFEQLLDSGYSANPDIVSDLFVSLTDDLAYARTYFPNTRTVSYLNQLTRKAHQIIYRSQPAKSNRIIAFWKYEFPQLVYSARKQVLISFLIFFISALIGLISNRYDPDFVRIIMGDHYVNMTLANIDKGDPMAVYKSMNQVNMFLGISVNNIYISFLAFVFGVFTALGTGFMLFRNGIMMGVFQGFMAQKGLLMLSVSSIWIHGTLEIFAIIVAGAAGIVMGNSLVFPGTFTRGQSFRTGAVKGTKMVIGLMPVFLVAAFLEGFVTRYSNLPYVLKFSIIGLSLIFIVVYFFIYPKNLKNKDLSYGKRTS